MISESGNLEGSVFTTEDGIRLCWIKSRYSGDLIALQEGLLSRFGGARHSDLAYFGSVRMLEYDRGSRGKMLLHLHNSRQGSKWTDYSLGLAG